MLAPATLASKLIIQELWKQKLECDEELPTNLRHWGDKWQPTLHELTLIEIPRWYSLKFLGESAVELHVFPDASGCACGAAVYLRFKSSSEFEWSFVIGKLRIAPVKENSFNMPK